MAGIGVQLNKIFDKRTISSSVYGIAFSFTYTVAPMLLVMVCLFAMFKVLRFDTVDYLDKDVFTCTILYIFIFSLLTTSPFFPVVSRYISDKIFHQKYEDIRPCIYLGIITTLTLSSFLAIPFCIYAVLVGKMDITYMFTAYMCYLACSLTLSTMVYNLILKQYKKIFVYYISSMILTFVLSLFFRFVLGLTITYSMLLSLTIGFLLIASLELANVLRFFPSNSSRYGEVLSYYRKYWQLIVSNSLYTLGLLAHNFVFWTQPGRLVVHNTFVCNPTYDMASFLAILTNISASIFFISRMEMDFQVRYQEYMEAVLGGKLDTIEKTKKRMFQVLSSLLISLANIQFIISVVIYFLALVFLPSLGFSGLVMEFYPQLSVGFFISFLMYSELLILYYFDDLNGAAINSLIFFGVSFVGSLITSQFTTMWHALGFTLAAFLAFTFSYFRLRWYEKNIDVQIFCKGSIIKQIQEEKPRSDVYNVYREKNI